MPTDPVFVKAWKAIATIIASDYSSGYSGLNMSNRVIRGALPESPMVPYASVFLVDSLEETGPVLTRYSGNMVFEIYAFAGGGTLIQRMDRALQLGADIINSLTSDRSLGLAGQTDDILCSISALDGDRFGIPGAGVAFIQATVTFQSDRGV